MKIVLKIVVLLICSFGVRGQSALDFEKDFKTTVAQKITNTKADSLMNKYSSLFMWFYTTEPDVRAYPLKEMRNKSVYQNTIAKLFADTGKSINTLACLMAAATYDTTNIPQIKQVLRRGNYKNMLAAKSLMVLGDKDPDPIVKCIIANNFNATVQYLTLDFLNIEKGRLEKFARDSLFSQENGMQYLAVKAMAQLSPQPINEKLLRQAVVNYDTVMKGWAIAALAAYKANHILPLIKAYLNTKQLKEVSWRALAASTSTQDMDYINQMLSIKQDDPYFLNALLNSNNDHHLISWLSLLKKGEVPENYYIIIDRNEAIKSDKYFTSICEIITTSANEMQAYSLMHYFEGRKDKASIDFLNTCLQHSFAGIKEKAKDLLSH